MLSPFSFVVVRSLCNPHPSLTMFTERWWQWLSYFALAWGSVMLPFAHGAMPSKLYLFLCACAPHRETSEPFFLHSSSSATASLVCCLLVSLGGAAAGNIYEMYSCCHPL